LGLQYQPRLSSTIDSRYLKFDGTMEKIRVVQLKRSYENTGSVVCLTTKGRQLERNFEKLKPASHVPILGTILNIFDVFVAVFFSLLNSLILVKQLITSRYLFLCVWICLSVLFLRVFFCVFFFFSSRSTTKQFQLQYKTTRFARAHFSVRNIIMLIKLWSTCEIYDINKN
jgi:hypothetical protein